VLVMWICRWGARSWVRRAGAVQVVCVRVQDVVHWAQLLCAGDVDMCGSESSLRWSGMRLGDIQCGAQCMADLNMGDLNMGQPFGEVHMVQQA
jgi:hypothetical protein